MRYPGETDISLHRGGSHSQCVHGRQHRLGQVIRVPLVAGYGGRLSGYGAVLLARWIFGYPRKYQ